MDSALGKVLSGMKGNMTSLSFNELAVPVQRQDVDGRGHSNQKAPATASRGSSRHRAGAAVQVRAQPRGDVSPWLPLGPLLSRLP